MAEANIAVLIDYENVGLDSIQYLLDQLSDLGRVIIKRVYGDFSQKQRERDQLLDLGVEHIHVFRYTKQGKNASDIAMAIDAVDLLHDAPVDTFTIVSSDSDFVPLVNKLRASGKTVIGAGRREATSATLVKSCDRYIYLGDAKRPPGREGGPRLRVAQTASLVVRALQASIDDQGQVPASKLHQTMQRIDASFDFRALGHRTFRQFLLNCKEVMVTQPEDASDMIVRLADAGGNGVALGVDWDRQIDAAWSGRRQGRLSGQAAAAAATRILGVSRLKGSRFPSLDKLLGASEFLRSRWRRDGNAILRNTE